MEKRLRLVPRQLVQVAATDYPGAEILVSFPGRWEFVQRVPLEDTSLYLAGFPPSQERARPDHFSGLTPNINRSLTTYRLYKLFEPWPTPLLRVVWDQSKNEGRVLEGCRLRVQLQPIGQAQIWQGNHDAVLWERYLYESQRQRPGWQEELATFWQAVERAVKVNRILTQPQEPALAEGYREFLSRLGYAPDPDYLHWWNYLMSIQGLI